MTVTVLSAPVKACLEQERDRLTSERPAMIQAAIAAATVAIDQTLSHLNGLLADTPSSSVGAIAAPDPATAATQPATASPKPSARSTAAKASRSTRSAQPVEPKSSAKATPKTAAKAEPNAKTEAKTAAKGTAKPQAEVRSTASAIASPRATPSAERDLQRFDPKRLKAEFGQQNPPDAIMQIFQASPTQAFSQDDLINRLYDEFPAQDLIRARRSVSLTLIWGTRRGELVQTQKAPALYKLKHT